MLISNVSKKHCSMIRSSKVWFKTTSCAKGPVTRCNFPGNLERNSTLKRCKLVTNVWEPKSQKNWYSIPLKLMNVLKRRSVSHGAKYIIESHLSADRWSLTNSILPELDEVFLCTRYGIRKLENREVDVFQQPKNEIRTVPGTLIFV